MQNIVVLGNGMAGFGAAYRLHAAGITPVIYEENDYYGGHTASFRYGNGFPFDVGLHISFTKDPRIQDLSAESVGQQCQTVKINLNNYWRGYWPHYPVQLHLHGLPDDVIVFAGLFPMQYTRKYHLRLEVVLNNLVAWAFTSGLVYIKSDGTPWRPIVHKDAGPGLRCYGVDFTKIVNGLQDFTPQWDARRGARQLYEAYQKTGLKQDDFEGPWFKRIDHVRQLMNAGSLGSDLRWRNQS